ncbi:hypothetical protein [Nannocystis pusilla]|uniref:hypothetical protein n=1 Tax=Nannocystis pusilla TaxID=889268 RepID=UPI003B82A519
MHQLKDVFGIRAHQLKTYTSRDDVDGRFSEALNGDHHIVVYGSSKQGKTSLRIKHIDQDNCVIVRCTPKYRLEDIYTAVLRQEGVKIDIYETSSTQGKAGGS